MRNVLTLLLVLLATVTTRAAEADSTRHVIHRLELEGAPGTILHTNHFLKGENYEKRTMNHANTLKLKYAFMPPPGSAEALTYKGVYQGLGLAKHDFNPQLGNPLSVFLFQGATIKTLAPRLALNYEWNLGLAMGWRPYDRETNRDNHVIGSHVTAYINADFYLKYQLLPQLAVNAGIGVTHFSNGNTAMPNAGLNTLNAKIGVAYLLGNVNGQEHGSIGEKTCKSADNRERRWQTDVLLYGAWKCKGVDTDEGAYAIPGRYGVVGMNVTPMRRLNPWLRLGGSLDAVYDHSANIELSDYVLQFNYWNGDDNDMTMPAWYRQVAVGLSARVEFTMPYFAINFGVGHQVVNAHGDFNGLYEILALKIALTRHSFVHIGYSLFDYRYPNNLMLGLGCRL